VKKAASTQAKRVAPFENHPFAILKEIFDQAGHLGYGEFSRKHFSNGLTTFHRSLSDLMVDGMFVVQGGEFVDISSVKRNDPR
jgi:hypothetical protein